MKSFPCRVLVTRSPSLHTKPRPAELLTLLGPYQGPAIVAVLLRILLQLGNHQFLQFLVVAEEELQPFSFDFESLALLVQLRPVQPGELPEAQVDDVFRLPFSKFK